MSEIKACINFCAGCKGVTKENGEWVCGDTDGKFYGLPISGIMIATCYKPDKKDAQNANPAN